MAAEDKRVPFSTEVSRPDLQLSARAIEGHQDDGMQSPERRRNERRRARASGPSKAVRLAVGQLLGGRYRIERELGEGGMGVVYLVADEQRSVGRNSDSHDAGRRGRASHRERGAARRSPRDVVL